MSEGRGDGWSHGHICIHIYVCTYIYVCVYIHAHTHIYLCTHQLLEALVEAGVLRGRRQVRDGRGVRPALWVGGGEVREGAWV